MIVALFDCDGTLFSALFGRGLMKYTNSKGRKGLVRLYYASLLIPFFLKKLGLISEETFSRRIIANLAMFIKGWNDEESKAAFDWVVNEYLLSTQRDEVVSRLRSHQAKGHEIVLVSAQYLPSLEILGKYFNADAIIGTEVEKTENRYSGRITPPVIVGQYKNLRVRELFSSQNQEIDWEASFAYADSITDLELFDLVGNPVAVFPDLKLNEIAQANNWEIIGTPTK